ITEITEGIGDSGFRAGIIGEIGTMAVTATEERILRASARAQLATGAAISLHTHPNFRHGERIVGILTGEGVPVDRIIVGHMDENLVGFGPGLAHMDYHRRLADLGVWLQYDTFGAECYYDSTGLREPLDAERASAVAIIAARATSASCCSAWTSGSSRASSATAAWGTTICSPPSPSCSARPASATPRSRQCWWTTRARRSRSPSPEAARPALLLEFGDHGEMIRWPDTVHRGGAAQPDRLHPAAALPVRAD